MESCEWMVDTGVWLVHQSRFSAVLDFLLLYTKADFFRHGQRGRVAVPNMCWLQEAYCHGKSMGKVWTLWKTSEGTDAKSPAPNDLYSQSTHRILHGSCKVIPVGPSAVRETQ